MKTWIGRRDATSALADLGCRYGHLVAKRKAGELDGLCMIDKRTKQGHWLYDVDGIREKVMSGELYFGAHRPPVITHSCDITAKITMSLELADKLLKCDKDTETALIQELRNAVGLLVRHGGASNLIEDIAQDHAPSLARTKSDF